MNKQKTIYDLLQYIIKVQPSGLECEDFELHEFYSLRIDFAILDIGFILSKTIVVKDPTKVLVNAGNDSITIEEGILEEENKNE